MIHIKETEIIPFLKTAQTGYTKMISEGDLEMEVELAEKVEEALTQAMDIIYDYQSMADEFTTRRKASPFNFCGKWGGITNDAGNNNGVFVLRERWL